MRVYIERVENASLADSRVVSVSRNSTRDSETTFDTHAMRGTSVERQTIEQPPVGSPSYVRPEKKITLINIEKLNETKVVNELLNLRHLPTEVSRGRRDQL